MELAAGTRLGAYEIVAPLGEGGMGEVYKARDTRVNRLVAIKVAKDAFSERFAREADAIAALNHPNICTLYDVGPNYLVMEFIDGRPVVSPETGPLPLADALRLATQIADALDHAHRAGVTHRDLKPANILVTKTGVKVLDFGLAKIAQKADGSGVDAATRTIGLTQEGTILGTLQYMSPEQVEGKEADARSDIFAFGVVLFEMITGRKAFEGKSAASILASVMRDQPTAAPELMGPVEPVLRRCLAKDPEDRFQSARDLKWALQELRPVQARVPEPTPAPRRSAVAKTVVPWVAAGVFAAVAALVTWAWWGQPQPETRSLRFSIDAPAGHRFINTFASTGISPDGRMLVFGAAPGTGGAGSLWLRPMDSLAARQLPGTSPSNFPFWSPDGKSVGFLDGTGAGGNGGQLKRVEVLGGAPQVLCKTDRFEGASWGLGGVILFSGGGLIQRVPDSGGTPERLTHLDKSRKETSHRWPQFLPDGRSFLYLIRSLDPNIEGIYVATLDDPARRTRIVGTNAKATYVPPTDDTPGSLLWMRDRTLVAQRFDAGRLQLRGEPAPIAEDVAVVGGVGADLRFGTPNWAAFWVSEAGLLLYRTGGDTGARLTWLGRDGMPSELLWTTPQDEQAGDLRLSPDGTRVALNRTIANNTDIWVYEIGRGVMTRLTFDAAPDEIPVWSPDGRQIVFRSERSGTQIYRKDVRGSSEEERITEGSNPKRPVDWSRDGKYVLFEEVDPQNGVDLWVLPLASEKPGDRKPVAFLRTPFNEWAARFSPDGKWIAYQSNETGRPEVYIRPFPPSGGRWQVSNNGGQDARWRGDGKELYYRSSDMRAVEVRPDGGGIAIGATRSLFQTVFRVPSQDTSSDGRFIVFVLPDAFTLADERANALTVMANWPAALKK